RTVAKFSRGTAYSEINHLNITRVTDIFVSVRGRDVGAVAANIQNYIERLNSDRAQVPEGYSIHMRGEVQSMQAPFKSIGFGLVLAVVLVYLGLTVQFRSVLHPLIRM